MFESTRGNVLRVVPPIKQDKWEGETGTAME